MCQRASTSAVATTARLVYAAQQRREQDERCADDQDCGEGPLHQDHRIAIGYRQPWGGRDWFIEMTKRFQESGAPPVSFALLMGSEFKAMAANQRRNLEENRIALIETVCRKR